MATWKKLGGTTALGLVLMAQGAQADVTAAQVWEDLNSYMSGFGYQVTATEEMSGDTLTIRDYTMEMDLPEGEGTVKITLGELSLVNNGDGTVSVIYPAVVPLTFDVEIDGEAGSGTVELSQSGMVMTVSGDPNAMVYDYSADSLAMDLVEIVAEGETLPSDAFEVGVTMNGLSGQSTMNLGNIRTIAQSMMLQSLTYTANLMPPDEDGKLEIGGSLAGLEFEGSTAIPDGIDPQDMPAMLGAGFAVDGGFSHKGGRTEFSFDEDGEVTSGNSSSTSGSFGIVMNADTLEYSIGGNGIQANIAGGEIPFPVALTMAQSLFSLKMPIGPNEQAEPFGLALTLGDFTMSDMIWSIFDPQEILPRDPATIAIDLTGAAKVLFNILDPEQMAELENSPQMPAELDSVNLNNLLISAAGAQIDGIGSFTFDNSDMSTFPGVPRPEGAIDANITGINGLMDKLIQMGLLPEDQAMGARMMMSMFTVPGEGDDTLKTKIEVNEQGHVLANGQRLR